MGCIFPSRTLCLSLFLSLEIGWDHRVRYVSARFISAIRPAMNAMAVERHERVPRVRFADWLPPPPARADEVNRSRDKGWRLTSAVIRLCGSATMVIERDNEQPDVPAEMRRRNAGFIVATFSERRFLRSAREFLMMLSRIFERDGARFATFWMCVGTFASN